MKSPASQGALKRRGGGWDSSGQLRCAGEFSALLFCAGAVGLGL